MGGHIHERYSASFKVGEFTSSLGIWGRKSQLWSTSGGGKMQALGLDIQEQWNIIDPALEAGIQTFNL